MQYRQLLEILNNSADEKYREFNKRLLKNDNINVLGVRVPILRKIAKQFKSDIENLLSFPDEYYEVTFIKLTAVSYLDYEQFLCYIDKCVSLIDNWATCDCFSPKCISKHRDDFLPYINNYLHSDGEYYQRFALITLLHFYIDEKYLDLIFNSVQEVNANFYYVYMAAAWLLAEVLVKHYDEAIKFIEMNIDACYLDIKIHNKAIQKANESFRLSEEQKNFLKELKF